MEVNIVNINCKQDKVCDLPLQISCGM